MKQIIKLKESDLRKLVMEASAELLNPKYKSDEFDQDAFDAEGDEKQDQINASWDLLNDDSYLGSPWWDENENIGDNGLEGHYSLLSQGYDSIRRNDNVTPSDIMYAQDKRCSTTNKFNADEQNWFAAPNDEYFDDGMPPIIGQSRNDVGKFATRNPYDGDYSTFLNETIKHSVNKVIKTYLR